LTEQSNSPFDRLLKRLNLESPSKDEFIGGSGAGGVTANARLFGGLVAAQATMAALKSTTQKFQLHSLHSYFLRPGRAQADIHFEVTRSKDGRNFAVRNVMALQGDTAIFQLQASFMKPEAGVAHAPVMPKVAPPESLPNRDQLRGRKNWQNMPIDVRMVDAITENKAQPANQRIWIKAGGTLPSDPDIHTGFVVYASDRTLLDTAWRPHADKGELVGASLDHSIWFHQPPNIDDWLLYDMTSPVAHGGRGLAFGHLFTVDGECVATVAQEGLLRIG
jgi:acyl-CoA thioesterase-2